nr:hypothetical protein [Tanacetum cinerariifolium]
MVFKNEVENQLEKTIKALRLDRGLKGHIELQNYLCLNVEAEEHSVGDLNEPTSYKSAMLDPQSNNWFDAMNAEMQSMKDNQIWQLVDLPPKSKGYTQLYGVDYEETFSPVADIRAISILIAIVAFYDFEIWQMDIKIAFLNGYLDEDIYMDYLRLCFAMKDLREAAFILGIKIYRDRDDIKSQTRYVFILNGGAVDWMTSKQSTITMSIIKAEYIATSEAAMKGLRVADSHTGNHPKDDFTSLETNRRSYGAIGKRILFGIEGEAFELENMTKGVMEPIESAKEPAGFRLDTLAYLVVHTWVAYKMGSCSKGRRFPQQRGYHSKPGKGNSKEIDGGYVAFRGNPKGGKITGKGRKPNWLFDIDALTKLMNYKPVVAVTADLIFSQSSKSSQDNELQPSSNNEKKVDEDSRQESECHDQEKPDIVNSTNNVNVAGINKVNVVGANSNNELPFDLDMHQLEDIRTFNFSNDDEDDGAEADMNNLDTTIQVSPTLTTRINKGHPLDQMDVKSAFLYEIIKEEVYVCQPSGFEDPDVPNEVYKVEKELYALHQAPRACGSFEILDTLSDLVRATVSPMVSWRLGPPPESVPWELDSLGVALDWVLALLPLSCFPSKLVVVVVALSKLSFISSLIASSATDSVGTLRLKNINEEAQLHAKVDRKKVVISEASIWRDLQFGDEEGVDCLPNEVIFEQVALMGAKTTAWNEFNSIMAFTVICLATNQKFYFSKYIFDSMVKHLDSGNKFLMYPSAKTTAWNEFNSIMAFTVICLATNQKFYFSKYIFDSMVKHLDSGNKFLMYPRVGKDFFRRETPLFQTMMVQVQAEMGKESVADEAINEEMNDSLERATTTTTSLDGKHDRGNNAKTQSKATPNESSSQGTDSGGGPRRQDTMGDTVARTSNMRRVGKDFFRRETPLFQTMMVQVQAEMGKESVADEAINEEMNDSLERATTTTTSLDAKHDRGNNAKTQSKATPNESSSQGTDSGGVPRRQDTMGDTVARTRSERVSKISNDPLLIGVNTEDILKLNELVDLCTSLQNKVLALEVKKTSQAKRFIV